MQLPRAPLRQQRGVGPHPADMARLYAVARRPAHLPGDAYLLIRSRAPQAGPGHARRRAEMTRRRAGGDDERLRGDAEGDRLLPCERLKRRGSVRRRHRPASPHPRARRAARPRRQRRRRMRVRARSWCRARAPRAGRRSPAPQHPEVATARPAHAASRGGVRVVADPAGDPEAADEGAGGEPRKRLYDSGGWAQRLRRRQPPA